MGVQFPKNIKNVIPKKRITWILIFLLIFIFHGYLTLHFFPEKTTFNKYPLAARQFLEHNISRESLLDFSPLYFYFHVLAYKFIKNPLYFIYIIHILMITISSLLLFQILKNNFPPLLAWLGLLIFNLNRSVILYEKALEPESFIIFFLLAFAFFSLKTGTINKLMAGIFFTLLLLTRSNFFLMIIFVPIYFKFKEKNFKKYLANLFVFFIPVLMGLTFLWIRNFQIENKFSPFIMNPGYVFYEGNNPNSTGQSAIYPPLVDDLAWEYPGQPDVQHKLYRLFARRISGKNLSVSAVNQYWSNKTWNFILDHPGHFFKLLLTKTNFFFHNYRRHDLTDVYLNDQKLTKSKIPTFPFGIISISALLGMIILRKDWKKHFLLYLIFFNQFVLLLLTYVSARQRVAIVPFFIFFAVATCHVALKNKKNIVITLLIILPFGLFFMIRNDFMKEETHLWKVYLNSHYHWVHAKSMRDIGNIKAASIHSLISWIHTPWQKDVRRPANLPFVPEGFEKKTMTIVNQFQIPDFSTKFDRAVLFLEIGKLELAEKLLWDLIKENRKFKRDFSQCSDPFYYLGRIAEIKKNPAKAIKYFTHALKRFPGNPYILSHLKILTGKDIYRKKLLWYFDKLDAEFFLGKASLENGLSNQAVLHFAYVVKTIPEYRRGQIYYAVALGNINQIDQAAHYFIQAIEKRSDPVFFENEIITIFNTWAERNPDNIDILYYQAKILRLYGYFNQAHKILLKLLEKTPFNKKIKQELLIVSDFLKHTKEVKVSNSKTF